MSIINDGGPAVWRELADALRDATGPSRELDARLWQLLGNHARPSRRDSDGTAHYINATFPFFTDTDHIGQIIKVIGEKLPGCRVQMIAGDNYAHVKLSKGYGPMRTRWLANVDERADDEPALALCEAFCRAMSAMEDK